MNKILTPLLLLGLATFANAQVMETLSVTLPDASVVKMQLPVGSISGMVAVRQLQGRSGTPAQIFQEDLGRYFAKEARRAKRWMALQAEEKGLNSPDVYLATLAALQLKAQEEAAAEAARLAAADKAEAARLAAEALR